MAWQHVSVEADQLPADGFSRGGLVHVRLVDPLLLTVFVAEIPGIRIHGPTVAQGRGEEERGTPPRTPRVATTERDRVGGY